MFYNFILIYNINKAYNIYLLLQSFRTVPYIIFEIVIDSSF